MIVQEPPYEMVALFSDLEMQKLLERLIERGQEEGRRCTRPFRWRSLRDPRRDTVWIQPELVLLPFLRSECRFLIMWDHHGTGRETAQAAALEQQVVQKLTSLNVPEERVLAVALEPELERLLVPVWPKVKSLIGEERSQSAPEDGAVLAQMRKLRSLPEANSELDSLLSRFPKEVFEALIRLLRLRRAPPLYEKIGARVSLPALKEDAAASRIADTISRWFPLAPARPASSADAP
jgi:hypothetical protein